MRRVVCVTAAAVIVVGAFASPASAQRCPVEQPPAGRTLYVDRVGPFAWFISADADPSGVEVYYGINQPGVNRPLIAGARLDGSGARVYLVSDREGTVPEPDADADVRVGTSSSACVAVPVAGVHLRVP